MKIKFGDLPIEKWCYFGEIVVKISDDYSNMTKIEDSKNSFFGFTWKKISS